MAQQFILKIELGNEAMQTPQDIAQALREAAGSLDGLVPEATRASGSIRDLNGNRVGKWEIK
jgi:hypothetical protein